MATHISKSRRILAAVLAVCMLLSLWPAAVGAQEVLPEGGPLMIDTEKLEGADGEEKIPPPAAAGPGEEFGKPENQGQPAGFEGVLFLQADFGPMAIGDDDVCAIGEQGYDSLEAALAVVTEGGTIDILKDITLTTSLTLEKSVTLTSATSSTLHADNRTIKIAAGKSVALQGNLAVDGSASPVIEVFGSFALNGDASIIHTSTNDYVFAIYNRGGMVTINDGSVTGVYGGISNEAGGTLTVTGGTVTAPETAIDSEGSLSVFGGSIGSAASKQGIRVMSGTALIEGGTISGKDFALTINGAATEANVSGGSFSVADVSTGHALRCSGGTTTLTGGSFNGRVATTSNGSLHINCGTGSNSPVISGSVGYSYSGQHQQFFITLPADLPIPVVQDEETTVNLGGMATSLTYIIDGATDEALGAEPAGTGPAAVVKLQPTATGNFNLVLTPSGISAGQALKLTLPVTVTAASTDAVIDIAAISGVTAPVVGQAPVTSITATEQYSGSVSWTPAVSTYFNANTAYTATITLTPKAGYTLAGVAANFFTVAGASPVSNAAGSGVITAAFPATGSLPVYVCEVSTTPAATKYESLAQAVNAAADGQTITMLKSFDHITDTAAKVIKINNKSITFNLAGYTLNIGDNSVSAALVVENGGKLELFGESGELNVTAYGNAVEVTGAGSAATVTNATSINNSAVRVTGGGQVTVRGDAEGKIHAIAAGGASDTLGSTVTVGGNAINTDNDRTVIAAAKGSKVTVEGNVTTTGTTGTGGRGVDALDPGTEVHIKGSVEGRFYFCVDASESAQVIVDNNVISTFANTHASYGVRAQTKAQVTVGGNVQVNSNQYSVGVWVKSLSGKTPTQVAVGGTISGKTYIKLDETEKTEAQKEVESTLAGYHTYTLSNTQGTHTVWVKDTSAPANACSIGGTEYASLAAALGAVQTGETKTIKLLKNIDYNGGIILGNSENKHITFDLNSFTLNVVNSGGPGVSVTEGSSVDYVDNTASPGTFNVTGRECGVRAWYGDAKVSNATATAPSTNNDALSYGVYARYGAQVTVNGNASGKKFGAYADSGYGGKRTKVVVVGDAIAENVNNNFNPRIGANATNYADIEVAGNASGGWIGVAAESSSTAKVGGKATGGMYGAYADLNSSTEAGAAEATGQYGAAAYNGNNDSSVLVKGNAVAHPLNGIGAVANAGNITIDGVITAPIYVRAGSTDKNAGEYTVDGSKPGYRKYSDGTATVWVKEAALGNICAIGSKEYTTLMAAITDANAAGSPQTIRLLRNITENQEITITGDITFNLDGYNLTIDTSAENGSTALYVNGGKVNYSGNGRFDVIGNFSSVRADGSGASATVSYAESTTGSAYNVQAGAGGKVVVKGNALCRSAGSYGLRAVSGGNITVEGAVLCLGENSWGVYSTGSGSIATVKGGVTAAAVGDGSTGVNANNGGKADITGNITASEVGVTAYGTTATEVTVTGSVTVEGSDSAGISIGGGSTVTVTGNVTVKGSGCTGLAANSGNIRVGGKLESEGLGAETTNSGTITVDGVFTASGSYVKVGGIIKGAGENEAASSTPGYREYKNGGNIVWIKETSVIVPPAVLTGPVTSLTATGATLSGTMTSDGGGAVTEIGYVYGASPKPVISGSGVSKMTLGNSYSGPFTISITSLTSNTTYHVRAYAKNSAGVAYGADVSFTTLPAAPATYLVTVNGSYASPTGAGTYAAGATVSIHAGSRTSYTFTGWTSPDVTISNAAGTDASFTMPAKAVTVTAGWSYNGGGGGGGGGGSTAPSAPTYNADVKEGTGTETKLPVTVNAESGAAVIDAGAGKLTSGDTVVTMPSIPGVDIYTVGIPVPDLSTSDAQGSLIVETGNGSITVPSNMLTGIPEISGSKAQVSIGKGDKSALPEDVKAAIGDRPLIQLALSIDGQQTNWSNPGAAVTVSIPYTPTAAELANPESIVIWYIDGAGNAVAIPNGRYDAATGTVTFATTHFSYYAVTYHKVSFSDVAAQAWYHDAVSFLAARGITGGTGNGKYSPDARLTRGEFIVMLMRAYEIAADVNYTDNFSDGGNTWYTGHLAAAKRLRITAGVGNNMYAPARAITRQEMYALLYNTLKALDKLPAANSGKILFDFSEAGGSGEALQPDAAATRAELAQALYHLLTK